MDKETRNKLRNTVVQCRRLLEEDILDQLEGTFGIHRNGRVEDEAALPHLDDEGLEARRRAVATIEHIQGYGIKPADAVDQFQREVAFTHLNRLCAFKMLERRGLLEETVSRGTNSNGFKVYLASHPDDERLWRTGDEHTAYKHFLFDVCARLSDEIKVLFDTEHVSSYLFPSRRALEGVLELINAEPLADIWDEDETIGWIYQYFTPKELREKSRKESRAPRTSYELAFRNQFYTPRYVVQFLSDNTLARTWYEMRKGETRLADQCEYMVRRPTEIFLGPGEEPPPEQEHDGDLSQEELLKQPAYVRHRENKPPWEIKVLDPACGSGHFLLYAFDLLETIYEEAYDDPDIGLEVQALYSSRERYAADGPAMILRHNLHGIDIDLRSTQIAALALWMRAQRRYQRLGLNGEGRPRIERTNIVCAEPMPGDEALLDEFCESLTPTLLGDLVRQVWEKMKLAGEAGSLLKIEEEIREVVRRAQEAWRRAPKGYKISLFDGTVQRPVEQAEFDFSEVTGPDFWQRAEALLLDALELFAGRAANGREYGRRLFADDAEQGFAFIELCRGRYDVVLMNLPFGSATDLANLYLKGSYSGLDGNLFTLFVLRAFVWAGDGGVGAITDNAWLKKTDYAALRDVLANKGRPPQLLADLGWDVLDDANVAVCAFICTRSPADGSLTAFRLTDRRPSQKAADLKDTIVEYGRGLSPACPTFIRPLNFFKRFPENALAYETPDVLVSAFEKWLPLEPNYAEGRRGYTPGDTFRFFRCWWEVPQESLGRVWWTLNNGSSYVPLVGQGFMVARHEPGWSSYRELTGFRLESEEWFGRPGLGYGKRTDHMYAYPLPAGAMFSNEGHCIFPAPDNYWFVLGYLNSHVGQSLLNLYCGQHKTAGYVSKLPTPDPVHLASRKVALLAEGAWRLAQELLTRDETKEVFSALVDAGERPADVAKAIAKVDAEYCASLHSIDSNLVDMLRTTGEVEPATLGLGPRPVASIRKSSPYAEAIVAHTLHPADMLQYCVGIAVARWDVRIALDRSLSPRLQDVFEPLPVCPPGMLVGPDGLSARPGGIVSEEWLRARPNAITLPPEGSVSRPTIPDNEYPLQIVWDGILVDDPAHQDDIVRRIREVLELLWKDRAEAIEQEACGILGVKDLREYFRNPKHFWEDHVKRYSKSRRKAPIYWLLQSPRRYYGLWLYYHRLDKDLLYKALRNYVDPKFRLEESRLRELRDHLPATPEGRERKTLEKQIDDQETIVNGVLDFKERLEKVAALGLDPDLNDGVILNIAPLRELVPWKEPKQYWDDLLAGKYEWSTIGKQLREKGLVRG